MRHAFLAAIVLSTPLLACPGDDEGETAATTMGNGSTGGGTTAAASTGEPGSTSGSGGVESSGGSSGPADGSTTASGPDPVDACTASCEHLVKCDVEDVPSCGIPCAGIGAMIGACEAEYLAQQECVVALSCEDLQAWADAMMSGGDHPCATQDGAFQDCIGGGSGSSG